MKLKMIGMSGKGYSQTIKTYKPERKCIQKLLDVILY
jgi:hypothetical protein